MKASEATYLIEKIVENNNLLSDNEVEALTHAIEVMRRSEWRPIETAPKDGRTRFDCWFQADNGRGMRITNCYWHRKAGRIHCGDERPHFPSTPTHWMPLPPAPEGGE